MGLAGKITAQDGSRSLHIEGGSQQTISSAASIDPKGSDETALSAWSPPPRNVEPFTRCRVVVASTPGIQRRLVATLLPIRVVQATRAVD